MHAHKYRSLKINRSGTQIAELELLGPSRGNAMGPDLWRELPQAVAEIEADPGLRALIVRGSGEHFSYGLDLPGMANELGPILSQGARGRVAIVHLAAQMQSGFAALANSRLPIIAAIDGWCIGAGLELACACDLRIATHQARFALREVKVGIVADLGGLQRLPHIVGEGWARELALLGDDFDAQQALSMSLVTRLVENADNLQTEAKLIAERLCANPPLVTAGIKTVMNARIEATIQSGNHLAASLNGMLMQSEDFAEAMRAFMERRSASFQGQ